MAGNLTLTMRREAGLSRGNKASSSRPLPKDSTVSAVMSRMPRSSTKPEIALRRGLHATGLRFTVNRRDLPGRPDIVFSKARLAVFVDGCFWHRCDHHGVLPKNNREWWEAKLARNVERDREKDAALEQLGWMPLHVWEHDAIDVVVARVRQLWMERTGRV